MLSLIVTLIISLETCKAIPSGPLMPALSFVYLAVLCTQTLLHWLKCTVLSLRGCDSLVNFAERVMKIRNVAAVE